MKRKGRAWIIVSVLSRTGVLMAILLGALWPTYLNLYYAYNNARIVGLSHGKTWETVYRTIGKVDIVSGSQHLLPASFFGTPPSMTIFGVSFLDPVVSLSLLISGLGEAAYILPGLVAVLLMMLIFGRGYCSFGCPASLVFTVMSQIRERLESHIPSLREFRRALPGSLRWGILLGGTVAAVVSGAWVWSLLLPYSMISRQLVNLVLGVPLGITFSVLVFIVISDFLVFPGEFCRSVCPLGLLLGRTSRLAVFQLSANEKECTQGCNNCLSVCNLSLDPRCGTVTDCNLCGHCVASCPVEKLSVKPKVPIFNARAISLFTVFFILFLIPINGAAHHYHGLPHYGYFDNYPQTPIEEFIEGQGRWELNFTLYNFQGMQKADVNQPGDVQIFLVVFDLKNKEPFAGRAKISIRDGEQLVQSWDQEAEQESIFFLHTKIPTSQNLVMNIQFEDPSGKLVSISSPFTLPGEGGHNPLLFVGCALVFLILVMVFASKQKRPIRTKGKDS